VDSLAALIKAAVGEDVPNGQLEPGRVVPKVDGEGYFVYVGVRRYHALRSLYEETKDERFSVFNAYIDQPRSLIELFLRVRRENEEGKGERVGLSVLEKIFGLRRISGSVPREGLDEELKRELGVAEKFDEGRIMKLFEVETAAHFAYRLEHLERLCQMDDPKDMFESAACTAGFSLAPERMEKAVEGRDAAYSLKWFGTLFPGYHKAEGKTQSVHGAPSSGKEPSAAVEGQKNEAATAPPAQPQLEIHEKEVIIVPCPSCGVENMVQMRLKAEVTRLPGDPEGESVTASPDAVVSCGFGCYHCAKDFHVFIRRLEGSTYRIEASLSPKFREPKDEVEAVDLRFDFEKRTWQKIVGDRIIGVVHAKGRSRK
jgi:hypothetical protein